MEKNENSNKLTEYIKYIEALSNFDKHLEYISKIDNPFNTYNEYLVNYKDFEELKKNINYDKYKSFGTREKKDYENIFNSNKAMKLMKIKQIEFKTNRYLINMLLNGNQFIFITKELFEVIGNDKERYEYPIEYKIDNNTLIISFKEEKKLIFSYQKNNIINIYNYKKDDSNYDSSFKEINKINKDINEYYKFEKEFRESLNNKKTSFSLDYHKKEGYLINKEWIDTWKRYTNYDEIKNKYLKKNIKIEEKDLLNDIIYYQEKIKFKYNDLKPFETYNPNTKEEFESYLEKESLIIINYDFRNLFDFRINEYKIKYAPINNKIYFLSEDSKEIIKYNAYKNIILSNENYNLLHFDNVIKIFYFKEEINNIINSSHKIQNNYNNNKIYLVNKEVLNKYKNIFNYDYLAKLLKGKKNIDPNNDNSFVDMVEALDKEYFNTIKKKDINSELNFIKDDYKFNIVQYEAKKPCNKNIPYILDFDIIDEEICSFFIETNILEKNNYLEANYIAGDGEIFFIIKNAYNENIYEIGYFDSNNNFIVEYLLQEYSLNNKGNIINFFNQKGIKFFINNYSTEEDKNVINANRNQVICYYYLLNQRKNVFSNNQINNINDKNNIYENKNNITNIDNNIIVNNNIFNKNNINVNNIINVNNNNFNNNNLNNNINDNNAKYSFDSNNKNNIDDYSFIEQIINLLLSIYSFEKEFKIKIEESKTKDNCNFGGCNIIHNILITQLKLLFQYNQIENFMQKWNISSICGININNISEIKSKDNNYINKNL